MSEQRTEPKSNQLDGITVLMNWYCGICKHTWKSFINQGDIRRMPSYVTHKGKRIETRRADGSMLRAHEECAQRMLKYMEDKAEREGKTQGRIIKP